MGARLIVAIWRALSPLGVTITPPTNALTHVSFVLEGMIAIVAPAVEMCGLLSKEGTGL